jgi:hypothetical protein
LLAIINQCFNNFKSCPCLSNLSERNKRNYLTAKGPCLRSPSDFEKFPANFAIFDATELTLTSVILDDCCLIFGLSADTGRLLIPKRLVGGGLARRPFFGLDILLADFGSRKRTKNSPDTSRPVWQPWGKEIRVLFIISTS